MAAQLATRWGGAVQCTCIQSAFWGGLQLWVGTSQSQPGRRSALSIKNKRGSPRFALWGMGTAVKRAVCIEPIAENMAKAYGIQSYTFDGTDFFNCYAGFKHALEEV